MYERRCAKAGRQVTSPGALTPGLFSPLEQIAIEIGWKEGAALFRNSRWVATLSRLLGSSSTRPLANKSLEALRAYAEGSRIEARRDRTVSAEPLLKAGYSPEQVATLALILGGVGQYAATSVPA